VPGWFAVASVKWLQRIIVTDRPFNGYYQTIDYAFWKRSDGNAELVPLRELQVKAEIARPKGGEIVSSNATVRVHGAAWSGGAKITKVEVTTDGGRTWNGAKVGQSVPNAWCLWDYMWKTPSKAGHYTLMAKASDSAGRTQPAE